MNYYLEAGKVWKACQSKDEAIALARSMKLEAFSVLNSQLDSVYDEWPKAEWV